MLLFFIVLHRYCVFDFFFLIKLKVCGNPASSKSIGGVLQYLLVRVSVSHFGSVQNTSNITVILVVVFCAQ